MRMTQFETIKGADEFIERIKEPLNEINNDIDDLNNAISKAQSEYSKVKDGYKIDDVQRKGELETQLKNLREAKKKASERKEEIVNNHSREVFIEARKMIKDHASEMNSKHKVDLEKIKELQNEIQDIIETYNQKNYEYAEEQVDFADAVSPYLATSVDEDNEQYQRKNLLRDVKSAFGTPKVLNSIELMQINQNLGQKPIRF